MEVEYLLEVEDVVVFNVHVVRHDVPHLRPGKNLLRVVLLGGGAGALLVALDCSREGRVSGSTVLLLVLLVFFGLLTGLLQLLQPRMLADNVRRMFRGTEGRGHLRPTRVVLSDAGVTTERQHERSFVAWAGIEKVTATDDHLYLFDAPFSAVIVPRRAFADEWRFRDFADFASRCHEEQWGRATQESPTFLIPLDRAHH
jgi:hypothetical protein